MTACVNRKHTKKVAAVVTASLVGALSLGVAPVAAMANEGIDLQLAPGGTDGTEFASGEIVYDFAPSRGNAAADITTGTDEDGFTTVTADQIPFTVNATSVKPAGTEQDIAIGSGSDCKVALYKADEEGEPTGSPLSGNRVLAAGNYVLTVTPLTGSAYVGQTFKEIFKVIPAQIEANAPYEEMSNGGQDKYLQFTGNALDLHFAMDDGTELVEGEDYTVKYTKVSDGKTYDKVVDAGEYTATLTGLGTYEGTSSTSEKFEVLPFNLVDPATDPFSHIVVAPYDDQLPDHPERVYWSNETDEQYDTEIDPELVNIVNDSTADITTSGPHTVSIKVDQDAIDAGNINYDNTNPIEVSVVKRDADVQFMYGGAALQDAYDVFPGQSFDVDAVKATSNGVELTTATLDVVDGYNGATAPKEYKVTFTYNATGVAETSADSKVNGKVFAASKTVTIRVWAGKLDADTQIWAYGPDFDDATLTGDAVAITSYAKAYDGVGLRAGDFYATNKDQSANTVNGELEAKLYTADGEEIDEAVDAGEYYLEITSDNYKLSGDTRLPITIGKVDLTTLEVGKVIKWNLVAGEEFLPVDWNDATTDYDCSTNLNAIKNLDLIYNTGNEADDPDASNDFKGMDRIPDNADVTVEFNDEGTWKPVANINDAGQYRVTVTVGEDVASNYVLPEGETSVTIEFTASQRSFFTDVQPSAWYYEVVNQAAFFGIMNGYSGTHMFGPEDTLTRGQVVCVLFNMSGASEDETGDAWNEHTGWNTGFNDVDGTQFYGEAIYWAKKTGVVNGYADGTFKPEQTVTREEFASMLANYAKVVLGDSTVGTYDADTVLAEYPDGEGVTDWAADNVAWAAAEGIMGNNGSLMPTDTMTRAYCAAMAMNYLDADRA